MVFLNIPVIIIIRFGENNVSLENMDTCISISGVLWSVYLVSWHLSFSKNYKNMTNRKFKQFFSMVNYEKVTKSWA